MKSQVLTNLANRFDLLQERSQRMPVHRPDFQAQGDPGSRSSVSSVSALKEFYLQRLAKSEPGAAARLAGSTALGSRALGTSSGVGLAGRGSQPSGASSAAGSRPTFLEGSGSVGQQDMDDLEILCNNCFCLIKASEVSMHGPGDCCPAVGAGPPAPPLGGAALQDAKLRKLRASLESRLQEPNLQVNVMRHLTQLRYHIDTALKWVPFCSEVGALSEHTVQQVRQLTSMSRVLAPAVYVFSKRIENVIVAKERELRRDQVPGQAGQSVSSGSLIVDRGDFDAVSVIDGAGSVVSELDSNCGTQYADTVVTQDTPKNNSDVGNVQDINECLNLKSEDERRRWFYSQCLSAKLACSDEARVKKLLISDLYTRVQAEGVPVEQWVSWIRQQLSSGSEAPKSASAVTTATSNSAMRSLTPSNSMSGISTTASGTSGANLEQQSAGPAAMAARPAAGRPVSPGPASGALGMPSYPQSRDLSGFQQLSAPPGGRSPLSAAGAPAHQLRHAGADVSAGTVQAADAPPAHYLQPAGADGGAGGALGRFAPPDRGGHGAFAGLGAPAGRPAFAGLSAPAPLSAGAGGLLSGGAGQPSAPGASAATAPASAPPKPWYA